MYRLLIQEHREIPTVICWKAGLQTATTSSGILMPVVITSSCLKRLDKSPEALRHHTEVCEEAVLGVVEEL